MGSLTPAQVRTLFPAASRLCYLNAAASSPLCLPVEAALREHLTETLESGDVGFARWLRRKEDVRAALAGFLGATPFEVAFTPSTSFGTWVAGALLRQLGVREVLTLAGEFPSTTVPLLRQGLALRAVRPRPDGRYLLDDLDASVTSGVGAVALSAVQYASGFRIDLEGVKRLCRAHELYLLVNVAQAVGQVPIDVQGVDFMVGTSQKWLMGGFGVGLFYARRALLESCTLPIAGWLSVPEPVAMEPFPGAQVKPGRTADVVRGVKLRTDASALELGAGALGPLFGLGAALELHGKVGVDATSAHNRGLQEALRAGLRQRGFHPNAPDDQVAGICVVPVEGSARTVASELLKQGVATSPRGGGLRISTHVFNDGGDLQRLFDAFARLGVRPASPES